MCYKLTIYVSSDGGSILPYIILSFHKMYRPPPLDLKLLQRSTLTVLW